MKEFSTKDRPLTPEQRERLARLDGVAEEAIDFSDMPEITDEQWAGAIRPGQLGAGMPVALFLDPRIVRWFREHAKAGRPFQADMAEALEKYIDQEERKSA